jgi:hypothetical protein
MPKANEGYSMVYVAGAKAAGREEPTDRIRLLVVSQHMPVWRRAALTTIFDLAERHVDSSTLTAPFDAAMVNDEHLLHGAIPVV